MQLELAQLLVLFACAPLHVKERLVLDVVLEQVPDLAVRWVALVYELGGRVRVPAARLAPLVPARLHLVVDARTAWHLLDDHVVAERRPAAGEPADGVPHVPAIEHDGIAHLRLLVHGAGDDLVDGLVERAQDARGTARVELPHGVELPHAVELCARLDGPLEVTLRSVEVRHVIDFLLVVAPRARTEYERVACLRRHRLRGHERVRLRGHGH